MTSKEVVFEFLAEFITCRNINSLSSPLHVSFIGCADFMLNAKSATACKIVYNKGKRLVSTLSTFQDLDVVFTLFSGHGDKTVRAVSSLNLSESIDLYDTSVPTVYRLEIGLDQPDGERFGVLSCSFQIIPSQEYAAMFERRISSSSRTIKTSRVSIRSSAAPTSRPDIPRLQIPPISGRSTSSIHERYLKQNEQWMGHRISATTEYPLSARVRTSLSTARK